MPNEAIDYRTHGVYGIDETSRTPEQKYIVISKWRAFGGVLVMGYETFRILVSTKKKQEREKEISEALLDPGPQLVICDEGHRIKNENAQVLIYLYFISSMNRFFLDCQSIEQNKDKTKSYLDRHTATK